MNILVTGIGGATPRSIARHLRKLYPNAIITGTDIHSKALGFYMPGLIDQYCIVPKSNSNKYWEATKQIIKENKIDLAFVQPENEVIEWGNYYKKNGEHLVPVLIPPVDLAKALIDKANMADQLQGTDFIPKTIRISPSEPKYNLIEAKVGYPCWIRATQGSGGYGSLKLNTQKDLEAWLLIHQEISEFTVSEFLPGRHLANQMLYLDGELYHNAGLECAEYVMANIAPSKVTGNTSFGRFINNNEMLDFCKSCISFLSKKMNIRPHGVLSFDLKEDCQGNFKVTEVNIRHMAYTGIMAKAGFDLIKSTTEYLMNGKSSIKPLGNYAFKEKYVFLRDVDIEPILLKEEELL